MARILVAYATKHGSTAEIAQAIGKELLAAGHAVDVMEMGTVASLGGYNAVIIGGPVYIGKMVGAGKFVRRHADELKKLPVAGFIVCLSAVSKDPSGMENTEKVLHAALSPLQPVSEAVFAGRLDPAGLSWLENWMTKKVKSPVGDFRDWTAIASWARELPAKMGI
jgi:menaquinone-dependent protoporphyrinogen oxidase